MSAFRLREYDNSSYQPGRSRTWQIAWFFIGLPILRCSLLPFSGLRVRLLRLFGAAVGEGVVIKPGFRVKYPWHLRIGDHCWLGEDSWIDNLTTVELGSNVCVSQLAYLCTGNHDWTDPAFSLRIAPIRICDGAWVGARAFIAPGVVLSEGAIASAGSVVTKNIPRFAIHAGNPAQFSRMRKMTEKARQLRPLATRPTLDEAKEQAGNVGVGV
jgi:putative colanic acid biosynthesis acetyltransferase WcaF